MSHIVFDSLIRTLNFELKKLAAIIFQPLQRFPSIAWPQADRI